MMLTTAAGRALMAAEPEGGKPSLLHPRGAER